LGLLRLLEGSSFPAEFSKWQVPLPAVLSLQNAVNALAHRELSRLLAPLAIWWTEGSNTIAASWLCTRGLPEVSGSVALLTGDWSGGNWATVGAGRVA
jgi:hypothetical protein